MSDIDTYAELDRQIKVLVKRLDTLKQVLLDLPNGQHDGERWSVWIVPKTQSRLDTQRLKKECPSVYEGYTVEISYREITVTTKSTAIRG